MRIVVVGAGVVGVTASWYLAEAGHEVTVLERQPAPGLETSFANGGQISVCHAEPWANPSAPVKVLSWLGHESSPLLWRLRADPAQWAWGMRFLRECLPGRTRHNIEALVRLGLYSRASLQALRDSLDLRYDQERRGILHIYTEQAEFDHAVPQAALMSELGCVRRVLSARECLAIEPALSASTVPLVGGTYTPDDESGDACKFTAQLAEHCTRRGVTFRYGTVVTHLTRARDRISGIGLQGGETVVADAYVVAAASYSRALLAPVGCDVPIYPAKGYSITIPLAPDAPAPTVSITDDGHKLVYSRLGSRLRVAGTAEFNGYNLEINPIRIKALLRRTRAVFPAVEAEGEIEEWTGLRPATPGNLPLIGASPCSNLYLDTGHGTLGWTLACGSGRLLADLVSGKPPEVDPKPYRP